MAPPKTPPAPDDGAPSRSPLATIVKTSGDNQRRWGDGDADAAPKEDVQRRNDTNARLVERITQPPGGGDLLDATSKSAERDVNACEADVGAFGARRGGADPLLS